MGGPDFLLQIGSRSLQPLATEAGPDLGQHVAVAVPLEHQPGLVDMFWVKTARFWYNTHFRIGRNPIRINWSKSPPPTIPSQGLRKATVNAPALGRYCGQDPCDCCAADRNPGILSALSCDASAARCIGKFTRQCWRHKVADVLPDRSIGSTQIRENSNYRIAVRNALLWCPEGETIVERARVLVLERHRPCRAAIDALVDAKIRRVA